MRIAWKIARKLRAHDENVNDAPEITTSDKEVIDEGWDAIKWNKKTSS